VGTADAGIWRYDGKELKHYTAEDGLCGYNIIHIFKNRSWDLWFVCNGQKIMYFDGQSFRPVKFLHWVSHKPWCKASLLLLLWGSVLLKMLSIILKRIPLLRLLPKLCCLKDISFCWSASVYKVLTQSLR